MSVYFGVFDCRGTCMKVTSSHALKSEYSVRKMGPCQDRPISIPRVLEKVIGFRVFIPRVLEKVMGQRGVWLWSWSVRGKPTRALPMVMSARPSE